MGRYDAFEEDLRTAPASSLNIWSPDPGGTLIGRVVSMREIETKNGPSDVIDIEDGDGKTFSLWISGVLRGKLEAARVRVGDLIGIRYEGRRESKNGREYKDYVVRLYEKGPEHTAAVTVCPAPTLPAVGNDDGDAMPF